MTTGRLSRLAIACALALLVGGRAHAAGFLIFEQGAKAMGMSQAYTAQADDPSAMFFNPGGLAFQHERDFMAGVTLVQLGNSKFEGAAPFPGPGARANQSDQIVTPIHVYWVEPINDRLTFGLAVNMPFGLSTEWDDPDDFPGRFISEKAELRSIDVNPQVAWQITDRFGVGVGVWSRSADVQLKRRAAIVDPFTQSAVEVARVVLESDLDTDFGWNVGVLHRVTDRVSWGASYRSTTKIDFGGDGRLTQVPTGNPALDALVSGLLPFDQDLPLTTSIEFPDLASLGVAIRLTDTVLFEADFNWAGWSTFDTLRIDFASPNDALDSEVVSNWDDANQYRFGVNWTGHGDAEWRFGWYIDETPQPDEAVSPLLPDADRIGYSVGWGKPLGATFLDLAVLYVDFDTRTTTTNSDGFQGTYRSDVWLASATIGW